MALAVLTGRGESDLVNVGRQEPTLRSENVAIIGVRDLDPQSDARALLDTVLTGPVDERVRDRIIAETRGNPLALLELPRGLSPDELAGGFGLPETLSLAGRIEQGFVRRLEPLPPETPSKTAAPTAKSASAAPTIARGIQRRSRPGPAGSGAADSGCSGGSGRIRPGPSLASMCAHGRAGVPVRRGRLSCSLREREETRWSISLTV